MCGSAEEAAGSGPGFSPAEAGKLLGGSDVRVFREAAARRRA
jgi:hypothetical protein